jgi:tetratricopeptide (TPR) repeat protein
VLCAFAERDAAGLQAALLSLGNNTWGDNATQFSAKFGEGLLARMTHNEEKAHAAFTAARIEQEKIVQKEENYGPAICALALIDASLGRKKEAMTEARRAIELMPVSKDITNGADMIHYSAVIAAWVGEKDFACEQLATALRYAIPLSYGRLKLLPWWDPLRGDPRFEKIVGSLAPKE